MGLLNNIISGLNIPGLVGVDITSNKTRLDHYLFQYTFLKVDDEVWFGKYLAYYKISGIL